jgi:lysophospholipase L1-like esterase
MQATNGSAVSFRTRWRLIGCLMALALAASALVFAPASASAGTAPPTTTYLALGDSISFGYTEERFNIHFPTESPSYFEEGVANFFAKDLAKSSEVGKSIRLVNDACPGETSNGMIGENPLIGGEKSTETIEEVEGKPAEKFPAGGYQGPGDWHPCKYSFENHLPLHNGGYYNPETFAEVSQLEEALATLTKPVAHEVKAITLNIGSNDELAAITQCKDEWILKLTPSLIECIDNTAATVTVPHIVQNIKHSIEALDGAGYKGPIIVIGFYNPDTFQLPGSDTLQKAANKALGEELIPFLNGAVRNNITFVNPFPVFNKGTTEPAELKSICKWTEMCNPNDPGGGADNGDIHPTVKGYKELAKLVNEAYLANPAK